MQARGQLGALRHCGFGNLARQARRQRRSIAIARGSRSYQSTCRQGIEYPSPEQAPSTPCTFKGLQPFASVQGILTRVDAACRRRTETFRLSKQFLEPVPSRDSNPSPEHKASPRFKPLVPSREPNPPPEHVARDISCRLLGCFPQTQPVGPGGAGDKNPELHPPRA